MTRSLTAHELFDEVRTRLDLIWDGTHEGGERKIEMTAPVTSERKPARIEMTAPVFHAARSWLKACAPPAAVVKSQSPVAPKVPSMNATLRVSHGRGWLKRSAPEKVKLMSVTSPLRHVLMSALKRVAAPEKV